jgi:hypothetical protein
VPETSPGCALWQAILTSKIGKSDTSKTILATGVWQPLTEVSRNKTKVWVEPELSITTDFSARMQIVI